MVSRRQRKTVLSLHQPDWWLIGLVLALVIFGVVMIGNASSVAAYRDFGDRLYFAKKQASWAVFGLFGFIFTSFFPYQKLRRLVPLLLGFSFFLLLLVVSPSLGLKVFGAQRWLDLGFVSFQPTELAKLAFVIYLAAFLEKKKQLWPLLIVSGTMAGLIMLQPDLGSTAVLVTSGLIVYFASGSPWWHSLGLVLAGGIAGLGLTLTSAYRRSRLLTLFNPLRDPLGASYHIRQVLIALGSGGLLGVGLGQSRQKYEYLPAVATDSIFAVVAEELGFIGAAGLATAYLFFVWRGLRIGQKSEDLFGRLMSVGVVGWLGVQASVNLAAMVALVPLTGITLPFVSYGGSSLLFSMFAAGILVNISRYTYD